MTCSVPGSASSHTSSRYGRNSGNKGITRLSFPSWWAVFGLCTVIRPRSQSTSPHRSPKCSEGHRRPPKRDNANRSRHWASGQAFSTCSAASRLTKNSRCRLPFTETPFMSAKGFSAISFRRTAARKNCLAIALRRRTVFSARPCPADCPSPFGRPRYRRHSSASPAVIAPSGLFSPKYSTKHRRTFPKAMAVRGTTSDRPAM